MNGYIYIRNHPSYEKYNGCKLGKANNIPERDAQYATGEIKRGNFELVIEMPRENIGTIEQMLQKYFTSLGQHIQYDGGREFYKRDIINQIVPYLEKTNINFKLLSKEEIDHLVRCNRVRKIQNNETLKIFIQNLRDKMAKKCLYIPRPYQREIITDSIAYFKTHDKGLLILMCGVGKTLISLWITQQLHANTVVIGVPNILLLTQWNKVICELFPEMPVLIVSGGIHENDIRRFIKIHKDYCIVITTYASSYKVNSASQSSNFKFSMKILDEVHHLTSHNMQLANNVKSYVQMLNIPYMKQLSLTATLKQLENIGADDNVVSNDNVSQFGEIIDRKNLLWAIKNDIICDYVVQTIIMDEEQLEKLLENFNITSKNDKRLFLSSYAALKSINEGHSHHLVIYSNNKENSLKLMTFIKLLLENNYFVVANLYYSNYHSDMTTPFKSAILDKFEIASNGILSVVYCLSEGWDFPLLDAVVFAENMSSDIRIVQSALRASRKYQNNPHKITKIILPVLNQMDDWLESNDNPDLKKVREVIYQLGTEDETIAYKIRVSRVEIKKQPIPTRRDGDKFMPINDLGEYDEELTKKLRLRTTARNALGITYEKARKIVAEKNIKTKEAYMKLCEKDNRLTTEPEVAFRGHFTSWIHYLSIERIYYDLETCKNKVGEYIIQHESFKNIYLDLAAVCCELCKLDQLFPPNGLWVDYYNIKDLRDIIIIAPKKKNKYDILNNLH